MNAFYIFLIVIGAIIVIFFIGEFVISFIPAHPKTTSMKDAWYNEMKKDFMLNYDMTPTSCYTIMSYDNYILHASFLPAHYYEQEYGGKIKNFDFANPKKHTSVGSFAPEEYRNAGEYGSDDCNKERFVIISHGYTYNRWGSLKYAEIFRKYGYNVVIYDDRGHGENEHYKCTFGINESRDLIEVIKDTRNRFGKDIALGVVGESMGTGLSITALKYNPDIDFIVADCGYSDLSSVIKPGVKMLLYLPSFTAVIAGWFAKLTCGYNFMKVRPIDAIRDSKIPICFVHGGADSFINKDNSKQMYDVYKGYKEYHEFEGAEHGQSIDSNPKKYEEMIVDFLSKVYS